MGAFRVLYADHRRNAQESIRRGLLSSKVDLTVVTSISDALEAVDLDFFHLALITSEFAGEPRETARLFDRIRVSSPSCERVLCVLNARRERGLYRFFEGCEAPATYLIRASDIDLAAFIGGRSEHFSLVELDIENLLPVVEDFLSKDSEYRLSGTDRLKLERRNNESALATEISFLMGKIFGPSIVDQSTPLGGQLEFVARRRGLSPSIAVEVSPQLGKDSNDRPIYGNRCWVKIGSISATRVEADKYRQVVKFGVEPLARVEMLDIAAGDRLGAICYSVAGGSDEEVWSLDDHIDHAIATRELAGRLDAESLQVPLAATALLLRSASSRWYRLSGRPVSIKGHYESLYRRRWDDRLEDIDERMNWLAARLGGTWHSDEGEYRLESHCFRLPTEATFSSPLLDRPLPTCRVHGDLHGGNVMVGGASGERPIVSLIDFANAGEAPRCFDAGLLSGSCRLWDGKVFGAARPDRSTVLQWVVSSLAGEATLLAMPLEPGPIEPTEQLLGWQVMAHAVDQQVAEAFSWSSEPVTREELSAVYMMHAQRMLTLPVDELQLLRVIAWGSTLVSIVEEANK